MRKKQLLIPVPLVMHTRLKWAARQEGKSMSTIVRGLIQSYLEGDLEPTPVAMPRSPQKPRGNQAFYDELAALVDEALS